MIDAAMSLYTRQDDRQAIPDRQATHDRRATLYRMDMEGHTCPFGLKAKDLLERQGFTIEDHLLRSKAETDAFKAEQGVKTTPQVFIGAAASAATTICAAISGRASPTPRRRPTSR